MTRVPPRISDKRGGVAYMPYNKLYDKIKSPDKPSIQSTDWTCPSNQLIGRVHQQIVTVQSYNNRGHPLPNLGLWATTDRDETLREARKLAPFPWAGSPP